MMLSSLLERFTDETDAGMALEALGDIILFAEINAMAQQFDEAPNEYVAAGASRFAALASDEDWLGLMSAIERTDDPARTVLVKMLRWALARDAAELSGSEVVACGCKGGAVGVSHGPT